VTNSPGLSSVRMARMARSSKERRKRTTNKESFINSPQRGKEQRHGGAYPAGVSYIAKQGRRLALLPRMLLSMDFVSQEHGVPRDGPKDSNAGG
jgi:hypothetical protein